MIVTTLIRLISEFIYIDTNPNADFGINLACTANLAIKNKTASFMSNFYCNTIILERKGLLKK